MGRETRDIEYKSEVSNTFLKTVSAYANFGSGSIYFGVADDGSRLGLSNPQEQALIIENKINNAISPIPNFRLLLEEDGVIQLQVEQGQFTPYTYKGKAYKRGDSSSIEVSQLELNRLILAGANLSYEELPARKQKLTFQALETELVRTLDVSALSLDILKTLDLYSEKQGYNRAAELLADTNDFPGVDLARFGHNISVIKERHELKGVSLISQLQQATEIFEREYTYELVEGSSRQSLEAIPRSAFREALANALIHRAWDVPAQVRVSLFPNYLEITSPGGLPDGVTEVEYLRGQLSILRNPILGTVFFRLGYIEKFGTGIRRIMASYQGSKNQPTFTLTPASITVRLPLLEEQKELSDRAQELLDLFPHEGSFSRTQLEKKSGLASSTLHRALKELIDNQLIQRTGKGPSTRYQFLSERE